MKNHVNYSPLPPAQRGECKENSLLSPRQAGVRGGLVGLALLSLLAGCAPQTKPEGKKPETAAAATSGAPVRVAVATEKEVTKAVAVTGSLAATETVELGAKVSARVSFVSAREGEPVRRGQLVIQQDTSDYDSQVRSSEAQIKSAEAAIKNALAAIESAKSGYQSAQVKLDQARTNFKLSGSQSDVGVKDAEQQLASAKAQLEIAKNPQRTQEVSVAENGVAQAQANYERAVSDRKRYENLVREGAAAQITLDQYATQEKVAKATLDTAKSQLELAQIGGRDASIRQSQAAVARAEFGLKLAKSNVQQTDVRKDDIKAAQAGVSQAKAALSQSEAGLSSAQAQLAQARAGLSSAQQQVANTKIYSSLDGIVSKRSAEVGQLAAPGGSLLSIVALDTVFFEAQVPETEIAQVKLGMAVEVKVDALPGRSFSGSVAKLYPTGSTSSRSFVVRVALPNPARTLRPGMFARGSVVLEKRRGVVVSKDALVKSEDGAFAVFVAKGDTAEQRKVTLGVTTAETAEIRSGVSVGEQVIVVGQTALRDGAAIRVIADVARN